MYPEKFEPGSVSVIFEISEAIARKYRMDAEFRLGKTWRSIPFPEIYRIWAVLVESEEDFNEGLVRLIQINVPDSTELLRAELRRDDEPSETLSDREILAAIEAAYGGAGPAVVTTDTVTSISTQDKTERMKGFEIALTRETTAEPAWRLFLEHGRKSALFWATDVRFDEEKVS